MKKLLFTLLLFPFYSFSQTFSLSGKVTDGKESVPFANITAVSETGKSYGVASDLDGNYLLNLNSGKYELSITAVGFKPITKTETIDSEKVLDFIFEEDKKLLNEVVVTSVASKQSVTSVISTIRTLPFVADGISAEFIRRTPDRLISDALKRVSGVTIQSDRFVLVRGLSDRYNTAKLNRTILPTTEPDRRSFSFDILPTSLIDNIIVIKSASADLPGDFSGGLIQLTTKEVEDNFITTNIGTSWGVVSSLSGFKIVEKTAFPISFPSTYTFRTASLNERKYYTQQINSPSERGFTTIPNINAGVTIGRDWGKIKGLWSGLARNTFTTNFTERKDWQSPNELAYDYLDTLNTQTKTFNTLLNLTYLGENKYSWKTIYTHQSISSFLQRTGENFDNLQNVRTTSSNHFATNLLNTQIDGKVFGYNFDLGYNFVNRTQPDYRVNPIVKSLGSDESYGIAFRDTYRFWSILNEHTINGNLSREINNIKFGTGYLKRIRSFNARVFRYTTEDLLDEITNNTDRYDADVDFINAFFLYKKQFGKLDLSTGVRNEAGKFVMNTADFSGEQINVRAQFLNILPSTNLSYNLDNQKFRFSVSRTVARPEFREIANFAYYDFVRNAQVVGNPNLKLSTITNLDLKWELYPSKTENISVSLYGKRFRNPIEQIVAEGSVPSNLILTYTNPNQAFLYGIELEGRKNINSWLSVYTNTSIGRSSVSVNGIKRQLQGQSNYVANGGININHKNHAFNLSYNRIGERISAVGFGGYADIFENGRDVFDITYLRKVGKAEIKLSVNDVLGQSSVYYQKLQTNRNLIKTNNEQTVSLTLNYNL